MASGICKDAAVVGFSQNKFVWASHPGGEFAHITVSMLLLTFLQLLLAS